MIYKARDPRLMHYNIRPVLDLKNEYSAFDVRITNINAENNKLTIVVPCSGLFDAYVVSDEPFRLSLRSNAYDPFRATPGVEGRWKTIQSSEENKLQMALLRVPEGELICGYPTNFSKSNGKNYYHVQHIVALQYLSMHSAYNNEELNARLSVIAETWWRRTEDFAPAELLFEDPQVVLDGVNRGKVLTQVTDWNDLLDW